MAKYQYNDFYSRKWWYKFVIKVYDIDGKINSQIEQEAKKYRRENTVFGLLHIVGYILIVYGSISLLTGAIKES